MKLKPGVKPAGLKPELVLALIVAESVYQNYGYEMTVTSINDGTHGRQTLHDFGYAADLRTRNVPESEREPMVTEIQQRLGDQYDVILENDHIHLEYDPR